MTSFAASWDPFCLPWRSMESLVTVSRTLCDRMRPLEFTTPAFTYNPLEYAWDAHALWLRTCARPTARILMVGMNPGPFGMAQTGVPFGDVPSVRDWIGVSAPVGKPPEEHPKRPVEGFEFGRREGSGKRLWGWAEERFGTADAFFEHAFVHNYCPLLFVHESGRNIVPEKLTREERDRVFAPCDDALRAVVEALAPDVVIGVGKFAETRASEVLGIAPGESRDGLTLDRILHPSPASPAANRDWAGQVEPVFRRHGLPI